jgi:hypothetical protein
VAKPTEVETNAGQERGDDFEENNRARKREIPMPTVI